MPYQINRYNGDILVTVEDGTTSADKTTLTLVGRNYAGYGEIQNENFVFLLENFANPSEPKSPLSGQIWYKSSEKKLKFYTGDMWKTTGGAEVGPDQPLGLATGDFWYNTTSRQLFTRDNEAGKFILKIGRAHV